MSAGYAKAWVHRTNTASTVQRKWRANYGDRPGRLWRPPRPAGKMSPVTVVAERSFDQSKAVDLRGWRFGSDPRLQVRVRNYARYVFERFWSTPTPSPSPHGEVRFIH